jgi:DNA helicase-2/ATP-dependent DNA helicase PcrA
MQVLTLFGPPGTGKTTAALNAVEKALQSGLPPERIAYTSFTRKAAREAAERAVDKFGFDPDRFPHFRTLHSMAYHMLGLSRDQVMNNKHWHTLSDQMGLEMVGYYGEEFQVSDVRYSGAADQALTLYGLSRARMRTSDEEWRLGDYSDIPRWAAVDFCNKLTAFKQKEGLKDFADFMDDASSALDVDIFVIDEAQDLTPQQWAFARRAARKAKHVMVIGDDDQAIFAWAGADASQFTRFTGTRIVLPKSYRLPKTVFDLSAGIVSNIRQRVNKKWSPREDEGEVTYEVDIEHVDMSQGQWLVLARYRSRLDIVEKHLRGEGFVYTREGVMSTEEPAVRSVVLYERLRKGGNVTLSEVRLVCSMITGMTQPTRGDTFTYSDIMWPWGFGSKPNWMDALTRMGERDREYVRALLRRGEKLTQSRIILSTIHGAKGGEADNVLLMGGITRKIKEGYDRDPDAEWRVWYVGATRAKNRLVIVGDLGV